MEEAISLRRSIWVSSLITLVSLAVFIGLAALIPVPADSSGIVLLGVFLSVIPALIWLGFFYQQDRSEPEPKRLVARVFAFGALAAAAVTSPIVIPIEGAISQFPSLPVRLLLTILSISLIQEVLKVAMVRYVVLGTDEFDRHPDGIVYGLASGLGFATVLTADFVLRSSGVIPLAGAIRAVDNALVHGALGAVSGYYLGRVKIDGKKLGWMAQGLGIVTLLNGVYQVLRDELSSRLAFNPWYSLGAAFVLALVVGAVLFAVFRRALLRARGDLTTVSLQAHARSLEMPWDIHLRYDALLIGALVVALLVGLGTGIAVRGRAVVYDGEEMPVQFRYPARWAIQTGGSGEVTLRDLTAGGLFKPVLAVTNEKLRSEAPLDFLVVERLARIEQQDPFYTQLSRQEGMSVDGYPAIRVEYEYVAATANGPSVVRGVETYVLVGTRLYIFRYEAERGTFEEVLPRYEQLLKSVQFQAGAGE